MELAGVASGSTALEINGYWCMARAVLMSKLTLWKVIMINDLINDSFTFGTLTKRRPQRRQERTYNSAGRRTPFHF